MSRFEIILAGAWALILAAAIGGSLMSGAHAASQMSSSIARVD